MQGTQGCVRMASTSRVARALKDEEVVDIFEVLPSDVSDLSEFESDRANEAVCSRSAASRDSENEKMIHSSRRSYKERNYAQTCSNGVVVILFQKNHLFSDESSGISVNINDDCTVFDIFRLFFPLHIM
jgi:Ulp1 family protease